jgi:hypothetical protein
MSQEDLIKRSLIATIKGTTVGGALSTAAAAGYIKGCTATRSSTGVIAIVLDPSPSFDPDVTIAETGFAITVLTTQVIASIADTSGTTKTLTLTSAVTPTVAIEAAFEVDIYRIFPS